MLTNTDTPSETWKRSRHIFSLAITDEATTKYAKMCNKRYPSIHVLVIAPETPVRIHALRISNYHNNYKERERSYNQRTSRSIFLIHERKCEPRTHNDFDENAKCKVPACGKGKVHRGIKNENNKWSCEHATNDNPAQYFFQHLWVLL